MPKSAILLFAHGSRDPNWAEPLHRIREVIAAKAVGVVVELAYLEFMRPTLEESFSWLANDAVDQVTLIPLFISPGKHLKNDLAVLLAEIKIKYPKMVIVVSSSIGDAEDMREAIAAWAYRIHRETNG